MTCSPLAYERLGWGWAIALPIAVVAGLAPLPAAADMTNDYLCWIETPGNSTYTLEGLCGGAALGPGLFDYGASGYFIDDYNFDSQGSTAADGNSDFFEDPVAMALFEDFANMYLGLVGLRPEEILGWDLLLNFLIYCEAQIQGRSQAEFLRDVDEFAQASGMSPADRVSWDNHWQAMITSAEATKVCSIL
ncbi:hypothetical protein [Leptolyngbya sp. PCC 6406]|uniref:hypothetical protein n=1 Tax=Leptolyngbya sp. PCC 6406 TaxID=1173264 RepID=UPI0002ACA2F6|nr:hypothetical protein [Leptolyngbya sp. PCC 6406]